MNKAKIAVFVSGGGTNLQALINAQKKNILKSGTITLVISDKGGAHALRRAEKAGIPATVITRKQSGSQRLFENALIEEIEKNNIDLIILAGFMSILSEYFTSRYPNRIINIHPSLIPSFCGPGYYGIHVHEAALRRGVKVTGATVHYVNEIPDGGEIILQKSVKISANDTPETLQRRVMKLAEWKILPAAAEMVSKEIMKNK